MEIYEGITLDKEQLFSEQEEERCGAGSRKSHDEENRIWMSHWNWFNAIGIKAHEGVNKKLRIEKIVIQSVNWFSQETEGLLQ